MITKKNDFENLDQARIEKIADKIGADNKIRRNLVYRSHVWFSLIFLRHHFDYRFAPFQKEMFQLSEDTTHKIIAIMAFRCSGKSTIISLSYVLWAILGKQQKKCVIIISKNQQQVKTLLTNIRYELESNHLLSRDLGPFKVNEQEKWGVLSIELPLMNACIIAISRGQSIRGIKHGSHRPDLIVIDDIEDSKSVDLNERNFVYEWFQNEVLTIGDQNTKIMIVGNLVRADSFMMKIMNNIEDNKINGIFKAYPLLDNHNRVLWPERFPSPEDIKNLQKQFTEYVWNKDYLLRLRVFQHDLRDCDKEMIAKYLPESEMSCPCKRSEPTTSLMAKYCISVPIVNDFPQLKARRRMFEMAKERRKMLSKQDIK